ncbi:Universal stress protein PHOS32 [Linum grandiflorum]
MTSPQKHPESDLPIPPSLASLRTRSAASPRRISFSSCTPTAAADTPTSAAQRRIAIAVDLSDESAHAVNWAVQNYLRPGDAVILLHVRPTSVLYGADWGSIKIQINNGRNSEQGGGDASADDLADRLEQQQLEDDYDSFTTTKANAVAQPLVDGGIPFKIRIVKDHDMKERLCLEVERLGLSAVVMGSRGFGATRRRNGKERLGSVSDYCVHHCICPVVVVRYPEEDQDNEDGSLKTGVITAVPEEQEESHDGSDEHKDA